MMNYQMFWNVLMVVMTLLWMAATWVLWWRLRKRRCVVFTRSWRKMGREEIAQQLAGWGESDPRWRALWDLYGEEFQTVLLEVHSVPDTLEAMLVWKGKLQMVLHMKQQMMHLRGGGVRE